MSTTKKLSVNGALAVARGGLREVVKRIATANSGTITEYQIRQEVATIRHCADLLEASVTDAA